MNWLWAVLLSAFVASPAQAGSVEPNLRGDGVVLRDHYVSPKTSQRDMGVGLNSRRASARHTTCEFTLMDVECEPFIVRDGVPGGTTLTPGMVIEAVSEVPMPSLRLHVQPDGRTLVNVDTIFYAEPQTLDTSIELLGVTIDIEATPVGFTWVHGDGTKQSTTEPGRAYPHKDVTHRYLRPERVDARVDTTYAVRFAIDGGDWTDLGEDLTATGDTIDVDVREALPILIH